MKYILLFSLLVIYSFTNAQGDAKAKKSSQATNVKDEQAPVVTTEPRVTDDNFSNMPVVIPNMTTVTPMPNGVKADLKIAFIPNGYRNKPVVITQKNMTRKKGSK